LTRRPNTLEAAIQAAMEVEVIDKENDRMERRFDEPIPTFIPLSHQPSEPLLNHHITEDYLPSMAMCQDLINRNPGSLNTHHQLGTRSKVKFDMQWRV
jgi:hypothetical protein